jgi:hypothetical protein
VLDNILPYTTRPPMIRSPLQEYPGRDGGWYWPWPPGFPNLQERWNPRAYPKPRGFFERPNQLRSVQPGPPRPCCGTELLWWLFVTSVVQIVVVGFLLCLAVAHCKASSKPGGSELDVRMYPVALYERSEPTSGSRRSVDGLLGYPRIEGRRLRWVYWWQLVWGLTLWAWWGLGAWLAWGPEGAFCAGLSKALIFWTRIYILLMLVIALIAFLWLAFPWARHRQNSACRHDEHGETACGPTAAGHVLAEPRTAGLERSAPSGRCLNLPSPGGFVRACSQPVPVFDCRCGARSGENHSTAAARNSGWP